MFISDYQTAKVSQPGKQTLHLPASLVATQWSSVLRLGSLTVALMWRNHLYPTLPENCVQRVRVIRSVADKSVRQFVYQHLPQSVLYESDLVRRSALGVYGDRKTRAVCHCHELRALAPLGFSNLFPPFLADMKVPSMKHSLKSRPPRSRKSSARACKTFSSEPSFTHLWKRRWQVWYGGYRSGRSCQGAPVLSTQRMPLRTSRLERQGRPRPSGLLGRSGNRGLIIDHCSAVRSIATPTSEIATMYPTKLQPFMR